MSAFEKYCRITEIAQECSVKGGFPAGHVRLLAVTKNQNAQVIDDLYSCGVREFAENRITVLEEKAKLLAPDIVWHFIGKIQSNKVRKVLKLAKILHSVDSAALLGRIDRIAGEEDVAPELFIEVNVSGEESKSGVELSQVSELLAVPLEHCRVVGLMTMAPFDSSSDEQRKIFSALKKCADMNGLKELSMGMSNDYTTAAACGATIIRIGTALFEAGAV